MDSNLKEKLTRFGHKKANISHVELSNPVRLVAAHKFKRSYSYIVSSQLGANEFLDVLLFDLGILVSVCTKRKLCASQDTLLGCVDKYVLYSFCCERESQFYWWS